MVKKIILASLILVISCNSDRSNSIENNDISFKKKLSQNKTLNWSEKLPKNFLDEEVNSDDLKISSLSSNNEYLLHHIKIDENYLYQYLDGHLIAMIPIIIKENRILIYKDDKLLSTLIIDYNGNIRNSAGIIFHVENTNVITNTEISTLGIGYDLCMRACKATHRLLKLDREIDSICCFWYPR